MSANHDVEAIVLGTLLGDPKAVNLFAMLGIDDFDHPTHQMIFMAIGELARDGRVPTPAILAPQFREDLYDNQPVSAYLVRLATQRKTSREQLPEYIRALKEMAGRRLLTEMAQAMTEIAPATARPLGPFLDDAVARLTDVRSSMRRQRLSSFQFEDLARQTMERLRSGVSADMVDSGLGTLNDRMGGWPRGELTILAGRPSMGKSTIALSAMRQAAKRGVSALFFSLEMRGSDVTARLLSDAVWGRQSSIPYSNIIRNNVQKWEIERLAEVEEKMRGTPMEIDDQRGVTIDEIVLRARRYADRLGESGKRLDVVWIDHIGHVRPSGRYTGQRVQELGEITKAAMTLANELNIAVVMLSQLSRGVEGREDKRPQLADLRESGQIEEDANTVIFAYREVYYLERSGEEKSAEKEAVRLGRIEKLRNILELQVLKARNSAVFDAEFYADMGSNVIRDLHRETRGSHGMVV